MRNSDYLVQMLEPEYDRDVLRRKSFKVNIRLLQSSKQYKHIIEEIIGYMKWTLETEFEDYQSNPAGGTFGVSGANLGFPFNIVAFKQKSGEVKVMINPVIEKFGKATTPCKTNCGSIKLKEKIDFSRPRDITVSFFDIEGKRYSMDLTANNGSYTVQHEVEHNLGILIIDKYETEHGEWPKEYLNRLRTGEGVTLDDTLTKRLIFVVSWETNLANEEPRTGFNWYTDEADCRRAFNIQCQEQTTKNVQWSKLVCPLNTTQEEISSLIEKHLDGQVRL